MNKSTFTHTPSPIFVVVAFAIAGCGTAAVNIPPAVRVAVVTMPVEIVSHGARADAASKNALEQMRVADADDTRIVAVVPNDPRSAHDAAATPSFSARNQGACAWVLMGTGESFASKDAALAHAKEQKLADRRVAESCDFFRIESRPTVSMR